MFLNRPTEPARSTPSTSDMRRRRGIVAAIAAALITLGAIGAVPAIARHDPGNGSGGQWQGGTGQSGQDLGQWEGGDGQGPGEGNGRHKLLASTLVNFRTNAIFNCLTGADNTGIPTNNTANISSSLTTVSAVVTVHAPPFTTVFGQLDQTGCARLKFFSFTVGPSGTGTTTVTDLRVTNGAFVWIVDTAGDFQITPLVSLF